jgi:hypothetical protein
MKAFAVIAGILLSAWTCAYAVNGHAVSVAFRGSALNWGAFNPACPEDRDRVWNGAIVRFRVAGSTVTCDTILKRTTAYAQCAVMNFEGTKVAFYRWPYRLGKSPTSGRDTLLGSNNPSTISVINIDGTGLRDLCTIRDRPGQWTQLDWPAGDWIYYLNPRPGSYGFQRETRDIGRVNVATGANEPIYISLNDGGAMATDAWAGRFGMDLAADRIAFTGYGTWKSKTSGVFTFPPANGNVTCSSCYVGCAGACNPAVSASGGYTAGYGGWHNFFDIVKLSGGVGPSPVNPAVKLSDVATWCGGFDFGSNPAGEVLRFSANSDKWVLQEISFDGEGSESWFGCNQLMVNWVDKQAVVTSNNPKIPREPQPSCAGGCGTVYYGNDPGDFWLDGGSANAGKYEGADGVWRSVPGYVPTHTKGTAPMTAAHQLTVSVSAAGAVRIGLSAAGRAIVRITDMQGKKLYSTTTAESVTLPAGMLRPGMYLISERTGAMTRCTKVTVPR